MPRAHPVHTLLLTALSLAGPLAGLLATSAPALAAGSSSGGGLHGWIQNENAYTFGGPEHWSKLRLRSEIESTGQLAPGLRYKASVRLGYDAAYAGWNDHYPPAVRENQRTEAQLRENYLDFSAGNWDFRLGRQHVVWGEVIGLFFADVVSARDLREFVLPEFNLLRTPQWAARAEWSKDDLHAEFIWIPYVTVDNIGKPGADFYPVLNVPPGVTADIGAVQRPSRKLSDGNWGVRLSYLWNGWDMAGFYYNSVDTNPSFGRSLSVIPTPTISFRPFHDRIEQVGGTLGKDLDDVLIKAEAIYTRGRNFNLLTDVTDPDGLVRQNFIDWIVSAEFAVPGDARLNLQGFQRWYTNHNPDIRPEKRENGASIYLSKDFGNKLEGTLLYIRSLNRADGLFRPRLTWGFAKNWRMATGVDIFHGPPTGIFGQYDNRDRGYVEFRYSF